MPMGLNMSEALRRVETKEECKKTCKEGGGEGENEGKDCDREVT